MKQNITEQSAPTFRSVMFLGMVLSLTMGFIDVTASILLNPEGIPAALLLLSSMVMTAILIFSVYLLTWVLLSLILRERSFTLSLSVAVFWGSLFALHALIGLFSGFSLRGLFELGMVTGMALLISVATYYAWPVVASLPKHYKTARVLGIALPFVFGEILLLVLMMSALSVSRLLVISLGILGLGFILFVLSRTSRLIAVRAFIVFVLLIGLSPFALLIGKMTDKTHSSVIAESGHNIKHVILLTIDTLRADYLSCYDPDKRPTPNLDSLARDGILFSNAISPCSWTLPAFSSIVTGVSPSVHMTTQATSSLPDTFKTLAEYLREDGYYTAAIGRNSFMMPERELSQGFAEYNFFPKRKYITMTSLGATMLREIFPHSFKISASTKELTDIAITWLEENHQVESFFWLHYFDPHHPYSPPHEYLPDDAEPVPSIGTSFFDFGEVRAGLFLNNEEREWVRTLYESEVSYVDHNVGRVITTLKRLGIYDESLIIVTSDHGDEFWEHGSIEHGHTLYNELIHVPLIVKLPESMAASNGTVKQIETTVSTQSIFPTIMELCQIEYNKDDVSISPLTSLWGANSHTFNQQPIISTGLKYSEDRISIIFDDFKYIRFLSSNKEELYDLANDPMEQNSLVAERPDMIDRARRLLKQHNETAANLKDRFGIRVSEDLDLPKDVLERLRSLGYIK